MSNLNDDLLAAGYTPVPLETEGAVAWTRWEPPVELDYCTVCGCIAGHCHGPTDYGDLDPDTSRCDHWDDEAGESNC